MMKLSAGELCWSAIGIIGVTMSLVVLFPNISRPLIFGEKKISCALDDDSKKVQLHQQFWVTKDFDVSKTQILFTSNPFGNYINRMKFNPGDCREVN